MTQRIFITGMGIISSIGNTVDETYNSLQNEKTGISNIQFLDTPLKDRFAAGEVPFSNEELKKLYSTDRDCSRATLLALIASKEAVREAQLEQQKHFKTGLVSATTVGGMDVSEQVYKKGRNGHDYSRYNMHDCGAGTEQLARYHGITDYVTTISTACSSSANAIMSAALLIKNGILDCAVAGGTDCLTDFTLNGFNSLKILAPSLCNPFDRDRNGLNLGEGAAFVVLESEQMVRSTGKPVLCELKGYGNSCDAFHQTATSQDGTGPVIAMQQALHTALLSPDEIDYINLHGTGTVNNDITEAAAIEKIFKNKLPKVSSTKSYTGHTLGAAGAVETVISLLSLRHNTLFPSFNFKTKMKDTAIVPEKKLDTETPINTILSNSFGFGGNNTSLLFSKG